MSLPRQGRFQYDWHYAWVVVAAGFLAVFASLGLARFGLGMLLPSMGEGLGLSYSQMGLISTGNFVGYMAAVVTVGLLVRWIGSRWAITCGLALSACSMIIISLSDGFMQVLFFYVLTGIGSGTANVPAMVLVSYWFTRAHRGKAAGIIASGSGLAIILAGAVVPPLVATGADGWRLGWLALAAGTLIVTVICGFLLRNKPEDLGLTPVGHTHLTEESAAPPTPGRHSPRLLLLHLGVLYSLFGASYVIYLTFFVTSLVKEHGFTEASAGGLWASLGFLSLFSGPIFGTLSDRIGRRAGLMIVFAIQGSAYLLAAAPLVPVFLYVSAGLFGIAAWSIPSIMAAVVGDYFGAARAASTFGTITLFFGFGQIVGPGVAGWAAEVMDGFSISFAMAAMLAYLAVILAALMPRPAKPR